MTDPVRIQIHDSRSGRTFASSVSPEWRPRDLIARLSERSDVFRDRTIDILLSGAPVDEGTRLGDLLSLGLLQEGDTLEVQDTAPAETVVPEAPARPRPKPKATLKRPLKSLEPASDDEDRGDITRDNQGASSGLWSLWARVPERIGEFTIVRKIATGGMGVVYEGIDTHTGGRVAIKVILGSAPGEPPDERTLSRFVREVEAASRLIHPNIARVYGLGVEQDVHYMVMDYVDGPSLAERLRATGGAPVPLGQCLEWMTKILEAISYAHEQGIVHRDLKPGNILLSPDGHPKVVDFGLAKELDADAVTATGPGHIMGTPRYMSPEQAEGTDTDHRTDIYSLGTMLFELATGKHPYADVPPHRLGLAVVELPPPKPSAVNPIVSPALEAVILKAMAKKPDDRFATAELMLEAMSDPNYEDDEAGPALVDGGKRRLRPRRRVRRRR